jgi:hypothetical protein
MEKEFEKYEPQRRALQVEVNKHNIKIDGNKFKKTPKEKDELKQAKLTFKNKT